MHESDKVKSNRLVGPKSGRIFHVNATGSCEVSVEASSVKSPAARMERYMYARLGRGWVSWTSDSTLVFWLDADRAELL